MNLFLYYLGRFKFYCHRLHDFPVAINWFYKDIYAGSFFPCTTRLWLLDFTCRFFPLTYHLNYFKPRMNRHILSFYSIYAFPLLFSTFSCECMSCNDYSTLHGVNPVKKAYVRVAVFSIFIKPKKFWGFWCVFFCMSKCMEHVVFITVNLVKFISLKRKRLDWLIHVTCLILKFSPLSLL